MFALVRSRRLIKIYQVIKLLLHCLSLEYYLSHIIWHQVLVHMHAYTQQHRVVWHYGFSGQWGGLPDLGLACWCKYPNPEEKLEECSALLALKPNIRFSGGWLDWWAGGRRFETLQNHKNTQGTSLNLELTCKQLDLISSQGACEVITWYIQLPATKTRLK